MGLGFQVWGFGLGVVAPASLSELLAQFGSGSLGGLELLCNAKLVATRRLQFLRQPQLRLVQGFGFRVSGFEFRV